MVVATALTVAIAAFIAPWRVTTGLLMGGVLALFSHSWLKNSAAIGASGMRRGDTHGMIEC